MNATPPSVTGVSPEWIAIVAKQVEALRFGVVQSVEHENRVVQIEKTEKVRLDRDTKTGNQFRQPVGLERLQSRANLLFIERGLPTALVPTGTTSPGRISPRSIPPARSPS